MSRLPPNEMAGCNERDLLKQLMAGPVSGDVLARNCGQTRAAIWKRIELLREAGIGIDAQAGRGYALAHPLDLLDEHVILDALPSEVRGTITDFAIAWSIDSSNSELLRRDTPVDGASVLFAERQTGGRGRRGRHWTSPLAANLYLSVARHFGGGLARLGGLSLVTGVAAAEALQACGINGIGLKWPNDLVVEEAGGMRKLGGVLIEGGGENAGPARAVIGIGINVRMPVKHGGDIDQPWIDIATLQPARVLQRNQLASAVLSSVLEALEEFDSEGLVGFLARYRAFDVLAGRRIELQGGIAPISGVAMGVAEDGALRVQLPDEPGCRHYHAGEVSVKPQ